MRVPMSSVAVALAASSALALECTTSQIGVVVSAAQDSANSIPCTQVAGFSISEFITSPTLTPTETQLNKATANPNCVALVKELQGLTISSNCEWWNVSLKVLLQLDFKSWVIAKTQANSDKPTATPTATTTTTKAPTTTTAGDDDVTTTKAPTTTAKTTVKVTTPRPTNATNNTNTSVPTTEVVITEAPFATDEPTEAPTTTKRPTTRLPTTTVPSSALTVACSIAAVAVAAVATLI